MLGNIINPYALLHEEGADGTFYKFDQLHAEQKHQDRHRGKCHKCIGQRNRGQPGEAGVEKERDDCIAS